MVLYIVYQNLDHYLKMYDPMSFYVWTIRLFFFLVGEVIRFFNRDKNIIIY